MVKRSKQQRRCFVLMPFSPSFDDVFATVKATAQSVGLECWRADERHTAGIVIRMIQDDIKRADVVIADLTGGNPNVFYETAFAHMTKDPRAVILLAQNDDDVPFDLRAMRYLKSRVMLRVIVP